MDSRVYERQSRYTYSLPISPKVIDEYVRSYNTYIYSIYDTRFPFGIVVDSKFRGGVAS